MVSVKLRQLTHLMAKIFNNTRWSSKFELCVCYQELRAVLSELKIDGPEGKLLQSRGIIALGSLLHHLCDLDSVIKSLQKGTYTITDVRYLFYTVTEMFPETAPRLSSHEHIVHNLAFESAIVKVLTSSSEFLAGCNCCQARCVSHLLCSKDLKP